MPANLAAVMAAVATKLTGITGLRVYNTPRDDVMVPAAVVTWPEVITYDSTMGRGLDQFTIPVVVLVGKMSDRQSGTNVQAYMQGSGSASVKAALEADPTLGGVVDTTRVQEARVEIRTVAGVDYLAANFTVQVYG